MQLADRLTLDAPKRTSDGYLAVRAKAARSGVYDYQASEVGAPDKFKPTDTVKVYRDESEVFAAESVRSFIGRPITNDHPRQSVTAQNWRDHARGAVMGAMRDGDYLAFDLLLMDAAAIKSVEDGKRELSNGYECTLDWTPGAAPDGTAFDARQVGIRGNHVALVDQGRAGPNCAIKDGERFALCDALNSLPHGKDGRMPHTLTIDGLQVADVSDAAKAALEKLQGNITDARKEATDAKAALATEQGKVTALDKQVADLKAELDPAKIDARVADRAKLIALAKAVHADVVTDGKSDADIRKAVVDAKLPDAKLTDDAAIAGAFAVLAKDAKPAAPAVHNIGAPRAFANDAATASGLRAARVF